MRNQCFTSNVLLYRNADSSDVKEAASNLNNTILDHHVGSVESNWHSFKEGIMATEG